ncbi:MAG TPA: sugar transferase [Candidatus Woesebacteria bacterium]|nr:sugar transferase [Candidatus Woesebacteria bacterium]
MTYQHQKRCLDIIVASTLIVLFLPFWIIVPLLIYLDTGTPAIFKHKRVGKGGREFYILKFRSMIPNAQRVLEVRYPELYKRFKAGDWKVQAKDDPRITKLGRILRAFTIDEFPQLFNVLKGEMSMVGPRAYVKEELDEQMTKYPKTRRFLKNILAVKPGLTGIWQTSGRNEIPFVQRAEIDAQYAHDHSIWKDIVILCKTPKAMISKW